MTHQQEFLRKRIEECSEGGDDKLANVFSYALKAAQYVEASARGFVEAYRNGELQLELYFNSVDHKFGGKFGEDFPIAYGFRGLIGTEDPAASVNEFPDNRRVVRGQREHVVLVVIRELMQLHQGMHGPLLGTHLVRLKSIYSPNCPLTKPVEPTLLQGRCECIGVLADRVQILKARDLPVGRHQCVDDVVEGRAEIVDDVSGHCGEFQGWMADYLKAEPSASAVVCIGLGRHRHIRSIVQVRQDCSLEPMHVEVSIPKFMDNASERMVIHDTIGN